MAGQLGHNGDDGRHRDQRHPPARDIGPIWWHGTILILESASVSSF
jgi:hypothetical protein